MAVKNDPAATAEEVHRLFGELREAYGRLADAVPQSLPGSDPNAAARFMEESHRVSDLIRKIRQTQGLGADLQGVRESALSSNASEMDATSKRSRKD